MIDYILIALIISILALATRYLIKAKQKGIDCIGCASAKTCASSCPSCKDVNQIKEEMRQVIKTN